MLRRYKISIELDELIIDIQEQVDTTTDYREGEAMQMATLFHRTMLAAGYPPSVVCDALGRVAVANGFLDGAERQPYLSFDESDQ